MFNWFKKTPSSGPDFESVDSLKKAERLHRSGQLERLFLMPLKYGGEDIPPNVVYVPVGIASIKDGIDVNVVGPLLEAGKVAHYSASPEYQGKSFIPTAINIQASEPESFATRIHVWGKPVENA